MGKFLFAFIDYLKAQGLRPKTLNAHTENVYLIGMFETGYGYNEEFYPENLEDGLHYLYEFKRKVSNSKYAVQSYQSTWRKLDKFIKSEVYPIYLEQINQ